MGRGSKSEIATKREKKGLDVNAYKAYLNEFYGQLEEDEIGGIFQH